MLLEHSTCRKSEVVVISEGFSVMASGKVHQAGVDVALLCFLRMSSGLVGLAGVQGLSHGAILLCGVPERSMAGAQRTLQAVFMMALCNP